MTTYIFYLFNIPLHQLKKKAVNQVFSHYCFCVLFLFLPSGGGNLKLHDLRTDHEQIMCIVCIYNNIVIYTLNNAYLQNGEHKQIGQFLHLYIPIQGSIKTTLKVFESFFFVYFSILYFSPKYKTRLFLIEGERKV